MAQVHASVNTQIGFFHVWNRVAGDVAQRYDLSLVDTARTFVLLTVAIHDGLQTSFTSKFAYGLWRPVTAIRNASAYQEERRRVEALAAIDRAKTEFFSNVSHEFRTPLTLMLGPTKDALDGGGALAGADLDAVYRNELRLLKLVNNLLDFSRLEAHRAQASYQPTDLPAMTRDLTSSFRSAAESAGLDLRIACAPQDEPAFVDRDMWEKIVLNLLSNAFKFTFEGSIAVKLEAIGDRFVLSVADTGGGIPEHEIPHLFERFHRVRGARARTHEGSGIGLALVDELVRMHKGTVSVSSQPGKGSTFTVSIPRGSDHLPADRIGAASELASTSTGAEAYVAEAARWSDGPGSSTATTTAPSAGEMFRERILLADDNADMRDYVRRILERHWRVQTVADGQGSFAEQGELLQLVVQVGEEEDVFRRTQSHRGNAGQVLEPADQELRAPNIPHVPINCGTPDDVALRESKVRKRSR